MKIFYHVEDDDGRCSAAVIHSCIYNNKTADVLNEEDFIPYKYEGSIHIPEFTEGEEVFIVDLALDNYIFSAIKAAIDKGCKVTHIDHHITSIENLKNMNDEDKAIMKQVTKFYRDGISASMLAWIFTSMTPEQQKQPSKVRFNLRDNRKRLIFIDDEGTRSLPRIIPDPIRYIDDNDVWRREIDETYPFLYGIKLEDDINPWNLTFWNDMFYAADAQIYNITARGKQLIKFQANLHKKQQDIAFEAYIDGQNYICMNLYNGNKAAFGDLSKEYPLLCKFYYMGDAHKWKYTLYISEDYEGWENYDIISTVKKYGGGGHKCAAGFCTDELVFTFDNK